MSQKADKKLIVCFLNLPASWLHDQQKKNLCAKLVKSANDSRRAFFRKIGESYARSSDELCQKLC